jgi:8-oxo-dGTP diphosphatase
MSYIKWIRSLVGQRKIFMPFASVIIHDERGRVLLQRRLDLDVWGLPGGILEIGEDILTCARRELLEETGLIAGELRLVGLYSEPGYDFTYPNGDQVQQYSLCFESQVVGGTLCADGFETSKVVFFEYDEIPFNQVPLWYADMLRDAREGLLPTFQPPYSSGQSIDQIQDIRPLIGRAVYHGVGSAAVLVNPDGHLLMAQRTDNGFWHFPGGYMHLGENAAYTVVRELKEETGLSIQPQRIIGLLSPTDPWIYPNGDQVQGVVTFFLARLADEASDNPIQVDQTETSQAKWVPTDQVLKLPTHPRMHQVNHSVLKHLSQGYFII